MDWDMKPGDTAHNVNYSCWSVARQMDLLKNIYNLAVTWTAYGWWHLWHYTQLN